MLRQQAESYPLALGELVGLVSLCHEVNDFGPEDAAANRDLDAVVGFNQFRRRAALGQKHLIDPVESAAFTLHEFQVVEQAGKVFIPANGRMQHVLRGDSQRKRAGIHHFQPIRVQVQKDVATQGVGPMDQSIDQKLAYHHFVEGRHVLTVEAIRQFVTLAEVGDLQPDRLDQLHRAKRVVVPHQLVHLLAALVVLDELNNGCSRQPCTIVLSTQAQNAQVREKATLGELVVIEQFVVGLFLDGCLDPIRCPQRLDQFGELVRFGS